MIYSVKTLIIAAILFIASMTIVGVMHLPFLEGENGFQTMENTFNSLRKGVKPPFDKIGAENSQNLGKNFKATFVFKDNEKARTATMIFLRNKLTVTPKGTTINIQGDLGYTLKFFMNDIHLLYMNRFDQLERRYSMPPTYSMYMLDRILKKLAISFASQKKKKQEALVKKIRQKLLIPAYNLRDALPVSETSSFTYLALGTLGILLFAILWDASNFLFFGTLASDDFMKKIRIAMGREMSNEEKALLLKREKIKKKKAAAAKDKKKKKGQITNKEALQEVDGVIAKKRPSKGKEQKNKKETTEVKKKKTAKPAEAKKTDIKKKRPATTKKENETIKPVTSNKKATPDSATRKVAKKKTTAKAQTGKPETPRKKKPQTTSTKIPDKKAVTQKTVSKTTTAKQQKATAPTKKIKADTSQKGGKKVTTHQAKKKTAIKATPEGSKKVSKKTPEPQTAKRKPVPEKPKAKQQDKT